MCACLVVACGHGSHPATSPAIGLTIYAAASLRTPLEAVTAAYAIAQPGVELSVAADSSAALRTQIEQGAPADVFLSADISNPQRLVEAGAAIGPPSPFAASSLAIIAPRGQDRISSPAALADPGLKIIAAGDEVPITGYAKDLIAKLANLPGYPPDFTARYEENIVSREDNVRAVLAKIELGEGDAGIVYETDAVGSDRVMTVPIPAGSNVAATYAGVVVSASGRRDDATRFLDWLAGPDGQAVLARFGFERPW
jgi:molybdate transport system substrate-binding protein